MLLTLLWPLLSLLPSDEQPQNHRHIGQSLVSLLWVYMLLLELFPSHEVRYLLITVKASPLQCCKLCESFSEGGSDAGGGLTRNTTRTCSWSISTRLTSARMMSLRESQSAS